MSNGRRSGNGSNSEETVLVLQGGGALGAYQAGVYRGTVRGGHAPDWVAGISIGAINAAHHRRQPAGAPGRAPAQVLGAGFVASCCYAAGRRRRATPGRYFNEASASLRAAVRRSPASSRRACRRRCSSRPVRRRRSASTTPRRSSGRWRSWSISTSSTTGRCGSASARSNVRTGNFAYFDNAEQRDPARARHGERRAAARLPAGRDRRRALLGRRPRLQHAAAIRAGPGAAPGHAGVPGRPVQRARADAAHRSATCPSARRTSAIPAGRG